MNHISYKIILSGGINEFDCMWTFDCMWGWKIIAYKSKINIFQEMRYFLMPYLNLGFIVRWASVLLIFQLQFSVNFHCRFWQECISTLFGVHTNFICNPVHVQINDRERLHIYNSEKHVQNRISREFKSWEGILFTVHIK